MQKLEAPDIDDKFQLEWVLRMPDDAADRLLVDMVAYEMQKKLSKKRRDGRGGWHGPNCSSDELMEMLNGHIEKGDMIDIINLAGMILARQKLYGSTA